VSVLFIGGRLLGLQPRTLFLALPKKKRGKFGPGSFRSLQSGLNFANPDYVVIGTLVAILWRVSGHTDEAAFANPVFLGGDWSQPHFQTGNLSLGRDPDRRRCDA